MEKVKEMIEKKNDLRKAAGNNSVPSNKPHYCVPWCCFFLWKTSWTFHDFMKISFMENKK